LLSLVYRLADGARDRARRRLSPQIRAGKRGEDLAHRFLRASKYTVVARNWRPAAGTGEIDLVAWDAETLVFAEVKTRASEEFGAPERAVDRDKQESLVRAARAYTRQAGIVWERVRFDVIDVILAEPPKITLLKNAFHA
jgi:putative endonuclease